MDTEKKLQQLLEELKKITASDDITGDAITRVLKISKNYEGYTSGGDDEDFFSVMNMESKDLRDELFGSQKTFKEMQAELEKIAKQIQDSKNE